MVASASPHASVRFIEIEITHPQLQAFKQPQAAAERDFDNEIMRRGEVPQNGVDFRTGEGMNRTAHCFSCDLSDYLPFGLQNVHPWLHGILDGRWMLSLVAVRFLRRLSFEKKLKA
jgi:hypothetical protein